MKSIIFSLAVLILTGCANPKPKQPDEKGKWSTLEIRLGQYRIIRFINGDPADSAEAVTYDAGSFFHPVKNVKIKKEKFAFTQAEKDSVFALVKDLVVHPVKPKQFCTDYVGSIQISVSYGEQIAQSCSYTSVCDWTKLSPQTMKLDSLLKKKIKDL